MSLTMWPRNDGQLDAVDRSRCGDERGLANCPAMRPTFTTGHARRVRQHDGHLQDDLQLVPDGVGREGVERLGAVAGLEQERLARGHLGQAAGQVAGLAGEDQRRHGRQRLDGARRARPRRASRAAARPGGRATSRGPGRGPRVSTLPDRAGHGAKPLSRTVGTSDGPRSAADRWSGGVDAVGGLVAHGADGPLHQAAGGLGGDAELLADLAVAALAAVVEAEALLDGVPGPGVEHASSRSVTICSSTWAMTLVPRGPGWRRGAGRSARCSRRRRWCGRARWAWSGGGGGRARRRARRRRRTTWRSAARRLAERSPGRRTRLAFWSRARPMAWRIQKVA